MFPRFLRPARALALPAALLATAATATAAPVLGPAGDAFYSPPSSVPTSGPPGELIWYRPATKQLGASQSATGYDFLYRSSDSLGQPNFVTGTVLTPSSSTAAPRATIAYAFGTQGLAPQCAPSRAMAGNREPESPNIAAALARNYTVVSSDYAGYTTGAHATYTAGESEGHAVLDAVRAARQIPGLQAPASSKTAVWGYSQGGQAAGWAGQLATSYAPDVPLVGVAAGGIPADLQKTAENLDGGVGASFLIQAIVGLANQYPAAIPFDSLANDAGKAAKVDAETNLCLFSALPKYIDRPLTDFTVGNKSLAELTALPSIRSVIDQQKLGKTAPTVPVYQYHGQADEIVPLGQDYQLKKDWCALGVKDQFDLYPSEHLVTGLQAAPLALSWIDARIAGIPAPNNCGNALPDPSSTAPPHGGDFVVNLDHWQLSGTTTLAKLGQVLTLPADSTFDGSANLTTQTLTGNLSIKPFTTVISLLGIKVTTAITLTPAAAVSGTIALDGDGNLHVSGKAPVTVGIRSLSLGPITLGTNCRTSSPLNIPLQYDGPVSDLGSKGLTFNSVATFPSLTGCGLYGPLLTSLISGGGNKFSITQTPPAPRGY